MKVNNDRKEVLMAAIDRAFEQNVRISFWGGTWQAGWASIGLVSPEEAVAFTDKILAVSDIAATLNRREIEFVVTKECDPEVPTQERFDECVQSLTDWLLAKDYRKVEAWLVADCIEA